MIRINQLKLNPGHTAGELENKINKILKLAKEESYTYEIVKCSVDARKKPEIFYVYTVDVQTEREEGIIKRSKSKQISLAEPVKYHFPKGGERELRHRPVIIGTGPAGLFCGYMLAINGYRPLLLERGRDVDARLKEVEKFWKTGRLDQDCNVQFGEGGAGTFSDGKLNTLVKDKDGRNKKVLSIFVKEGAPDSISYEGKPHIGTDILVKVVKNMRQTIVENGGEVRFEAKVTDILTEEGKICAVIAGNQRIETNTVVLAIGHSARDTFEMLYHKQVPMEAKAFAVGLRAEHPQKMINYSQYGAQEHEYLPPASYKLTAQTKEGRGVYSFCMCPGGYVVNASSEEGRLAVNGMSYSKRDGENANSAIIVSVTPEDYGSTHPLAGVAFQRKLEEAAYKEGNGKVPVEYYSDFKKYTEGSENLAAGEEDTEVKEEIYLPQIKGQWQFGDVHKIMPEALNRAFVEGMEQFDRMIPGFAADHVLLSGIESRTSSPVRIRRDEYGQSEIKGIYPCGEGAGYAGGITSAAMDGIRTAELIAGEYKAYTSE